ncbi:23S rRNA (uracil(1939)-C(5))-methyltransferase RlmD [Ectopseudomonas mendocina]|uniref:23S rRNA (uracil(1939)-C(5))-methyltransferase RlmD n=1 Tax=Ectopseudomonas mendocina TaxID=300 RepID=A0ABZ2RBD1_ECTME
MAKKTSSLRFQPSGGSKAQQVPVGKKLKLHIERQANDGRGIGFNEGRTWFVSGALQGEQVEARVLAAHGKVVEARVERVLEPSPARRTEACAHARACGGCSLQHMPHTDQLALKQRMLEEQLSRLAAIQPTQWAAPLVGPELGYRRRARVAVRWDPAARHLAVGFRASASQDIIDIEQCPVLVQPLQPILQALPSVLRSLEKPQAIGHVELFSGDSNAVLIRHTSALSEADLARLSSFCSEQAAQLWLQGKDDPQPYVADQQLNYRLEQYNLMLAYRPGDFVQVNQPVNDAMVAQALDWLVPQANERVLDLFCGLGNFALPLAQRVRELVAVEGVDVMVQRAKHNAQMNGLNNTHFYQADLSKPLSEADWAVGGFDAVLLDPPRDGALQVVKQMKALNAGRVLYVSCNPATLARDSAELQQQGYRLERAGILDMFPQTGHVEAMALFVRQ